MFLISDNIDTQMGMRLAGIDGVVVHERKEMLETLEKVMHDDKYSIVFLTTKVVEMGADVVSQIKLTVQKPLIVEIPDRHGNDNIGETIDKYVSEAIGVKM